MDKKRVVVVGGGFAGATICKQLDSNTNFHVTLLDTKDYFEETPAVLRAFVNPNMVRLIQTRHATYLKNGTFILGKAVEITPTKVFYEEVKTTDTESDKMDELTINDEVESALLEKDPEIKTLTFDYLVICCGSHYKSNIKHEKITSDYRAVTLVSEIRSLKMTKRIIIIGGGKKNT
jgi:NADH dehydrogenase FAD-containing subunit